MKKLLSVFLSLCLLSACFLTLVSCFHECEFSDEWSKDLQFHWHACTGEECEEIADKAEHSWDTGKITTKATQDADGIKTFTCLDCDQTRTEPVIYTGLTKDEWSSAFTNSVFRNFTYKEIVTTSAKGVSVDVEVIHKVTNNATYTSMTAFGETEEEQHNLKSKADDLRASLLSSLKDTTPYVKFKYDAQTKTYKATGKIYIESLDAYTSDMTLTFEEDRLVKIEYSIEFTQDGVELTATSVITISDYGTTVIDSST